MPSDRVSAFLADHPDVVGVLFTVMLLVTEYGWIPGGGGNGYVGP